MRNVAAVLLLLLALLALARAVAIIATKGEGRFRFDPAITLVVGFLCALAGQRLLDVD